MPSKASQPYTAASPRHTTWAWRALHDISHPCPMHPNWVNSSEAFYDSIRFTRYVPTRFAQSRVSQIDFRHDELSTGETIRVDSIESTRIDNIFNPPSKSRSTIFSKSRANRLLACRIDRRGNDSCRFDGIGFTNRIPVRWIANTKDESTLVWVYWTTLKSRGNFWITNIKYTTCRDMAPLKSRLERKIYFTPDLNPETWRRSLNAILKTDDFCSSCWICYDVSDFSHNRIVCVVSRYRWKRSSERHASGHLHGGLWSVPDWNNTKLHQEWMERRRQKGIVNGLSGLICPCINGNVTMQQFSTTFFPLRTAKIPLLRCIVSLFLSKANTKGVPFDGVWLFLFWGG